MPEAGRAVIKAAADAGEPHPWINPSDFALRMLAVDEAAYDDALVRPGAVVFDRGFPDLAGYLSLVGQPLLAAVDHAARLKRYNPVVFVAPPWRDIYVQDTERTQTFGEAILTHQLIVRAHQTYGYDTLDLPMAPVADRAQFVLETIRDAL